jgi:hypothetical protein
MQGEDICETTHRCEITPRRKALRIDFTGKNDGSETHVSALNLHRYHRQEIEQSGRAPDEICVSRRRTVEHRRGTLHEIFVYKSML